MTAVLIVLMVLFDTVLCVLEIPKMHQARQFRELTMFSLLLLLGIFIGLMKVLDITLPNPSDLMTWIYSPLSTWLKALTAP